MGLLLPDRQARPQKRKHSLSLSPLCDSSTKKALVVSDLESIGGFGTKRIKSTVRPTCTCILVGGIVAAHRMDVRAHVFVGSLPYSLFD